MTGIRPLPQAKYQLLLESQKSNLHIKIVVVTAVLISAVIGVAVLGYYLYRDEYFQVLDPSAIPNLEDYDNLPENLTGIAHATRHRAQAYALSLWEESTGSGLLVPDQIVDWAEVQPAVGSGDALKLVCYYVVPRKLDETRDDLQPEDIDPFLCTHVIVAFARIINGNVSPQISSDTDIYGRVVALKKRNSNLKVMLSVGGYGDSDGFPFVVSSAERRKRFVKQAVNLLQEFSFDGMDLDWEFPGIAGKTKERGNFTLLLKDLYPALQLHKLILSVAVAAPRTVIDSAYEVREMAKVVDFVNLMSYDFRFYVWYLPMTGSNSPLFRRSEEEGLFSTLNTNWSVAYWRHLGMPASKLVVGIPTYGHSFTLLNLYNNGLGAPAVGEGLIGNEGFVSFPEVCAFIANGATRVFDEESQSPYAYLGDQWVSYDDQQSVRRKAEFVQERGLSGAMVFSLNEDDFWEGCQGSNSGIPSSDEPLPLTWEVHHVLFRRESMDKQKGVEDSRQSSPQKVNMDAMEGEGYL
ncbi:chitinase-3-like protein 2 [Hetaerina americana]|uniref:chitinase-3-like protein 2 n=1 Tax=Hetaerina americana TaxID=62018 RepID=UPI003A7F4777